MPNYTNLLKYLLNKEFGRTPTQSEDKIQCKITGVGTFLFRSLHASPAKWNIRLPLFRANPCEGSTVMNCDNMKYWTYIFRWHILVACIHITQYLCSWSGLVWSGHMFLVQNSILHRRSSSSRILFYKSLMAATKWERKRAKQRCRCRWDEVTQTMFGRQCENVRLQMKESR